MSSAGAPRRVSSRACAEKEATEACSACPMAAQDSPILSWCPQKGLARMGLTAVETGGRRPAHAEDRIECRPVWTRNTHFPGIQRLHKVSRAGASVQALHEVERVRQEADAAGCCWPNALYALLFFL
eukprot:6076126-Pleurochrysis_carterae.AAC.6